MLSGDKESLPRGDAAQEAVGAEVAIIDPHILRPHGVAHAGQQRPLLCMPVFTREDIDGLQEHRIEDDQRQTRQGASRGAAEFFQAVRGGGQMIAIQNLDMIAWQQFGQLAAELTKDGSQTRCRRADQLGGDNRFDAIEFVVNRGDGNRATVFQCLKGGRDGGTDAANDETHKINGGREEAFPRLLAFGGGIKEGIQLVGHESVFHKS